MSDIKVLPCAHCGRPAKWEASSGDEKLGVIKCINCGVSYGCNTIENAIATWNTRHQPLEPLFYPTPQHLMMQRMARDYTELVQKYLKCLEFIREQTRYEHGTYGESLRSIGEDARELLKELENE